MGGELSIVYNPYTNHIRSYSDLASESQDTITIVDWDRLSHKKLYYNPFDISAITMSTIDTNANSTRKEHYTEWANRIIRDCQLGSISKAVAARKEVINYTMTPSNILRIFYDLIAAFPNAFVYIFYLDNLIWIGASPELLGRTAHGVFKTISIAGTSFADKANFTEKEIHEQQIVTNYLKTTLSTYSKELKEISRETTQYGDLVHLVTHLEIEPIESEEFSSIIHSIHPSPAISGFPSEEAYGLIQDYEPMERSWYSGMALFADSSEQYAFALIRCVSISANQMSFYAGAGITQYSDPEAEWNETQNKINNIKHIILNQ